MASSDARRRAKRARKLPPDCSINFEKFLLEKYSSSASLSLCLTSLTQRLAGCGRRVHACRRDWANDLSAGPAGLIAERVLSNDVADYIRFRAVCRAWRTSSPAPRGHDVFDRRFHPRRWIMIPRASGVGNRRSFLNLSTGECIHVRLEGLRHRHYLFGVTSDSEGLVVLCRKDTFVVHLVNPLTGQRADLPRAKSLLFPSTISMAHKIDDGFRVRSAGIAGDSTVALHYGKAAIAVAKPGDECWTHLGPVGNLKSAMSFAGRFYCVTFENILVLETAAMANRAPHLAVALDFKLNHHRRFLWSDLVHLVDKEGELILVHFVDYPAGGYFGGEYTAYRVNLGKRNMVPMPGLGRHTLFMGMDRSLLMMSQRVSPSILGNTVYVCYNKLDRRTGRSKVVAIGPEDSCSEPKFSRGDIGGYLARYDAHKYTQM